VPSDLLPDRRQLLAGNLRAEVQRALFLVLVAVLIVLIARRAIVRLLRSPRARIIVIVIVVAR
jgi:hypothetical protein